MSEIWNSVSILQINPGICGHCGQKWNTLWPKDRCHAVLVSLWLLGFPISSPEHLGWASTAGVWPQVTSPSLPLSPGASSLKELHDSGHLSQGKDRDYALDSCTRNQRHKPRHYVKLYFKPAFQPGSTWILYMFSVCTALHDQVIPENDSHRLKEKVFLGVSLSQPFTWSSTVI